MGRIPPLLDPSSAMRIAIGDARRALGHQPLDDESAHAVRKHLKCARAALRLLRGSVGERAYHRENRRLRDAARPLARLRDAKVAAQTLATLRDRPSADERVALRQLSARLAAKQQSARRELTGARLDGVARSLQTADHVAARWQKKRAASAAVCSDLKRAYRKARKAAASARVQRGDEPLHEARKQAKYLASMLKILRPRLSGDGKARRRAVSLGRILGEDHDLAVVRNELNALPDSARTGGRRLLTRIEERRRGLQRRAMRKAKRLYRRKPKRFARGLAQGR